MRDEIDDDEQTGGNAEQPGEDIFAHLNLLVRAPGEAITVRIAICVPLPVGVENRMAPRFLKDLDCNTRERFKRSAQFAWK